MLVTTEVRDETDEAEEIDEGGVTDEEDTEDWETDEEEADEDVAAEDSLLLSVCTEELLGGRVILPPLWLLEEPGKAMAPQEDKSNDVNDKASDTVPRFMDALLIL